LTKLADNGLQIEKDGRRQAVLERLIRKTQDGTLGTSTNEPMDKALEEDMSVSVGNETYIHHEAPPPAPVPQESKLSGIAKVVAASGLAAAGLGSAAAIPIAAWNLARPAQTTVVQEAPDFEDTDTDTKYNLRIFKEDK
jgi:hypothetical protein